MLLKNVCQSWTEPLSKHQFISIRKLRGKLCWEDLLMFYEHSRQQTVTRLRWYYLSRQLKTKVFFEASVRRKQKFFNSIFVNEKFPFIEFWMLSSEVNLLLETIKSINRCCLFFSFFPIKIQCGTKFWGRSKYTNFSLDFLCTSFLSWKFFNDI